MTIQTVLKFNSEKKHSVRFDAEDPSSPVSSLYIKKGDLPHPFPKHVSLTINTEEA